MSKQYFAKILKGIAGFYYCIVEEPGEYQGEVFACKARGIFRNQKQKPLVGDDVDLEITDPKDREGSILFIRPRKNALIRPAVANVDQVVLVLSVEAPSPALYFLDRYLLGMESQGLPVAICWNKGDLDWEQARGYGEIYRQAGCVNVICSAREGTGHKELLALLKGKVTVLAGPSGVGKSSLTNLLIPRAKMETGEISAKIARGRHTTRHSQLFALDESSFLMDTPGFTSMETPPMEKEELRFYFPEFARYEGSCRFPGCVHIHEPGCRVKEALAEHKIPPSRYDSYQRIYEELAEKRRF